MIKNLRVFSLTVGEENTVKSLASVKEQTKQPFSWTIWYDTCGRGIRRSFFCQMLEYTDDIFVLTKNHGTSGALAYAMLYLDYDYLLYVPADAVLQEGYLKLFGQAIENFKPLGCAGCIRVDDHPEFDAPWTHRMNDTYFYPDGVLLFSRKAIDVVGGIYSAFKGMGLEQREWMNRAKVKGFNLVSLKGIYKEMGTMHDGRKLNPNLNDEIEVSSVVYRNTLDNGNWSWWESGKSNTMMTLK